MRERERSLLNVCMIVRRDNWCVGVSKCVCVSVSAESVLCILQPQLDAVDKPLPPSPSHFSSVSPPSHLLSAPPPYSLCLSLPLSPCAPLPLVAVVLSILAADAAINIYLVALERWRAAGRPEGGAEYQRTGQDSGKGSEAERITRWLGVELKREEGGNRGGGVCVRVCCGLVIGLCWTSILGLSLVQGLYSNCYWSSISLIWDNSGDRSWIKTDRVCIRRTLWTPPGLPFALFCADMWTGVGLRCHAPVLLVVPEAWGSGAGRQEGGAPPCAKLRGYCLQLYCSCFPWPVGARSEGHCLAALTEVWWARQLA